MKKIKRIGKKTEINTIKSTDWKNLIERAILEGPTWDVEMEKFLKKATKKQMLEKISKLKKDEIKRMIERFYNI